MKLARREQLHSARECSADLVFASSHGTKGKVWSISTKEIPNGNSDGRRPKFVDSGIESMDGKRGDEVNIIIY